MHRNFCHPSSEELYALIKRANSNSLDTVTKCTLNYMQRTCDTCQLLSDRPRRFRVAIRNAERVFNRAVSMDLMKVNNRTVLYIAGRDTKFAAAVLLDGETTSHEWEAFILKWVAMSVGYSEKILLHQGK